MKEASVAHDRAMALVDQALAARRSGDVEAARSFFAQAAAAEREAADSLAVSADNEPTRAVLYRSAASLTSETGDWREAERLIAAGLAGFAPPPIAQELRDLWESVTFRRHLETRGIILEAQEIQLAVAGRSVGFGEAESDVVIDRVRHVEKLYHRTAERKARRAYRESGAPSKLIRDEYPVFLSAPRGGSFALTLRLGKPITQLELGPGFEEMGRIEPSEVVSELFACLKLFDAADEEALRERIPDPAYFRNFVGLAKSLSPDGEDVTGVGLTINSEGIESQLALNRPRRAIPTLTPRESPPAEREVREVIGRLRYADSMHPEKEELIKLVDEQGGSHKIVVPRGMMADIVKPLWDDRVAVTVSVIGRSMRLTDIQRVPED